VANRRIRRRRHRSRVPARGRPDEADRRAPRAGLGGPRRRIGLL